MESKSIPTNRVLVERFVETVWNRTDPDSYDALVSEDLVVHQIGRGEDADREAFAAFVTEFATAVPDLHFEIESAVAEGEDVIVHLTVSGTPEATMGAIRPTGESFTDDAFQRYRIADGRIAEAWLLPNAMGVMAQLGLLPDSPVKVVRLVAGQLLNRVR